jgi:hypothetical protein
VDDAVRGLGEETRRLTFFQSGIAENRGSACALIGPVAATSEASGVRLSIAPVSGRFRIGHAGRRSFTSPICGTLDPWPAEAPPPVRRRLRAFFTCRQDFSMVSVHLLRKSEKPIPLQFSTIFNVLVPRPRQFPE